MPYELIQEQRIQLAVLVMSVFDECELDEEYQMALLGLGREIETKELSGFRHGAAIPEVPEVIERARHVLGIQQALLRVFPLNPKMPSFWLYTRNTRLRGIPMEMMVTEGLPAMNRAWHCTVNWT